MQFRLALLAVVLSSAAFATASAHRASGSADAIPTVHVGADAGRTGYVPPQARHADKAASASRHIVKPTGAPPAPTATVHEEQRRKTAKTAYVPTKTTQTIGTITISLHEQRRDMTMTADAPAATTAVAA